jgi:predicted lipoprotein with Yx(FWY)xxD motif
MKRSRTVLSIERCAAIATALMISACAMDADAPPGAPALTRTTSIGTVLTDSKGMTLYTLSSDENGKSTCNGRCAKAWPPYLAPANASPSGKWSLTKRDDGAPQWAYAGKPLYFWEKDKQPGDVTGHKVGDVWWAARP